MWRKGGLSSILLFVLFFVHVCMSCVCFIWDRLVVFSHVCFFEFDNHDMESFMGLMSGEMEREAFVDFQGSVREIGS